MNKRLAFTLIELLVVIAVIGILSGLIVVSMSGVTNKATIAKSQVFSNSLRNSLMLNLVAEYKLDGNANDNWGNRNGTLHGTTAITTGCPQETCLSFNGTSSDYINIIDDDTAFNFGSKMTAMIWVKGSAQDSRYFFNQYDIINGLSWSLSSSGTGQTDKVKVLISDNGQYVAGHRKNYIANNTFFDNNWHLVGFTWDGTLNDTTNKRLKFYIDGIQPSITLTYDDAITSLYNASTNIMIGSLLNNGTVSNFFSGSIDEARLYNEAISVFEIKERYFTGLNNLLSKKGIAPKEYNERIDNILAQK